MDRKNSFNIFRFLAEVSTNLQKLHYLGNLRTITKERRKEIRQMTSFFYLLFELSLSVIFIVVFENCQNSFS